MLFEKRPEQILYVLKYHCFRIFSLSTGKCAGAISSPDDSYIKGICRTLLGGHLSAFYTNSDLFVLQVFTHSIIIEPMHGKTNKMTSAPSRHHFYAPHHTADDLSPLMTIFPNDHFEDSIS